MMKKRKSITRFAFNLIWMLPVLFLVLFACSSPKGEEDVLGDETAGIKGLRNVDPDSVSVKTFLEKDGSVAFFIVLGKERYLKLDVLNESGSIETLLNGRWGPDRFISSLKSTKKDVVKAAAYAYELEVDHERLIKGSFNIPIKVLNVAQGETDQIFEVVEKQPEFPGGWSKLYEYLSKTVSYPEQAKQDSIVGRVFVSFIVEKDGSISTVGLLRGIGGGCDEEAMHAVAEMPNWKPGEQRGQAVRVQYNLPIKFTLE